MLKRCKMKPVMQNYAYFAFLFEKGSKKIILFYVEKMQNETTNAELCIFCIFV